MTKEGRLVKRLAIVFAAFMVAMVGAELLNMPQMFQAVWIGRDIVFYLLIAAIIRWWWKRRRGTTTPVAAASGRKPSSAGLPAWLARVTPDDDWGRR